MGTITRFSSVKGVTFKNPDGTERQKVLETLKPADQLILKREKENPFDKSAIAVYTQEGIHLGYIGKELAKDLSESIDQGIPVRCFVKEITGGTLKAPTRGLNILLEADVA